MERSAGSPQAFCGCSEQSIGWIPYLMTTPQTILRESLLVLPLLAVLGFAVSGVQGGVPVMLGGLLSVVNFAALAWALEHMFEGDTLVDPTGVVIVKTTGSLLAWAGLMVLFSPIWVLVGANTVLIGIVIRGTLDALLDAGPMLAEET
ncbi:MAG: hypothetical protein ACJAZO_003784 [Myxococcota bacterium]